MQATGAKVISKIDIDRFQNDGFLLVEDFFTEEELDQFGKHVDAGVTYRTSDDHRQLSEKSLYEQTFVQCMRLWEDHESIRPLVFHAKLCASAAQLLQTDIVRLWHDQALYKEAGGRGTDAHMDYPFWPVDEPRLVSAWIPFDGAFRGGGIMGYVQGSHKMGMNKFVDIGQLSDSEPYDLLQETEVASKPLVWVEAPKGSVIFHHASTIHVAEANTTDATRRVFTTVYIANDCRRSRDDPYFGLDREGLKTGDLVRGRSHPVAWPQDDGELPPPPTDVGPKTGFRFPD